MANFWIQIVGTKDTGKTSLLEKVTRELVSRGLRVTYIKHTHGDPTVKDEDTDTARVRAAGAASAVVAGPSCTIAFRSGGKESVEELSFREALPGEIVLAEGFKHAPGLKIAVAGGDLELGSIDDVVAVVGDRPPDFDRLVFRPDQITEICDLIEKLSRFPADQRWATRLTVDGREIPLNTFVQDVMALGLLGMSKALRDVDGGDELVIRSRRIRRRDE